MGGGDGGGDGLIPTFSNVHLDRAREPACGLLGSFRLEVHNVPSENPRTGRLSYLSTIALLRDLGATLRVGT